MTLNTYSNCQKYPVDNEYLPQKPKYLSVARYDHPFTRYKVVEFRKYTEWPQTDLEHLTVKGTLNALNTYPETQSFIHFAVRPAIFKIQGCRKFDILCIQSTFER